MAIGSIDVMCWKETIVAASSIIQQRLNVSPSIDAIPQNRNKFTIIFISIFIDIVLNRQRWITVSL